MARYFFYQSPSRTFIYLHQSSVINCSPLYFQCSFRCQQSANAMHLNQWFSLAIAFSLFRIYLFFFTTNDEHWNIALNFLCLSSAHTIFSHDRCLFSESFSTDNTISRLNNRNRFATDIIQWSQTTFFFVIKQKIQNWKEKPVHMNLDATNGWVIDGV